MAKEKFLTVNNDNTIKIESDVNSTTKEDGALTINGGLGVNQDIRANKVYNAVWNDIADFIEIEEGTKVEFGKAYYRDKDGSIHKTDRKRVSLGIASDTYGFGVGENPNKKQVPIAIGGWVLACVDKIYEAGVPLVATKDGKLTKANIVDKIFYPERIIAVFDRVEEKRIWNSIETNGRHWVKVK